jgi:hypothetical protein
VALLAFLTAAGSARAAETYFQPQAEVGVEVDSNRNLVTSGDTVNKKETSGGGNADVSGIWGIATPRSDSTIRPEVAFSDYPNLHTHDLRTLLDLNSQFRSERSQIGVEGQFDRQSSYGSELANPQFNPVNPNLPTTPETGRISTDSTRTLFTAVPTYAFELTQRLKWGLNGTYQDVGYSGSNASAYIPYTYWLAGTSVGWAVNQRLDATLGAFHSREAAKDDSGSVTANGGTLAFDYKWSKQFTSTVELTGERDDSNIVSVNKVPLPSPVRDTSTGWGGSLGTTWKGQISKVQLSVGRTFTPSGSGGAFRADQLQIQYDRDLTPRLALLAAARVISTTALASVYSSQNYNYVNANAGLKWKMTPTWYIGGGVGYLYEHFEAPVGYADNVTVYISFGYRGLGKPY